MWAAGAAQSGEATCCRSSLETLPGMGPASFRQGHRIGWHEHALHESRANGSRWICVPGRECGRRGCHRTNLCGTRFCISARDLGFAVFEFRYPGGVERHVRQRVGVAIQFAADVFNGEILQLAAEFCGAFVQRLQVRAFHLVAALHLAHQQLGIAAHAQSGDIVAGGVIERGEQREIFGDVVGFAADIFRELQRDFSFGIAQHYGVRSRAGIAARSAVNICDVHTCRRRRGMRVRKQARASWRCNFARGAHKAAAILGKFTAGKPRAAR